MSVPTSPVDANVATSSPALIALSAAWGVYLTALRAANLFK
jgi:hypothetical protein